MTAVCYAVGPIVLSRWLSDLPSLGVIAASLAVCAVGYAPVAAFQLPSSLPAGRVLASVVTLAVVCTAIAFVIFFAPDRRRRPGPRDRDHLRQPGGRRPARRDAC